MIINYIKIAWRNLKKNRFFSLINIFGLAIGMTGALLILLWMQQMLTMNRFHAKGDRLYAISNNDVNQGERWAWLNTPKILGPSLKTDFPDIEHFSRYDDYNGFLVTYQQQKRISKVAFVDPGFLEMFSFPLLKGDSKSLLTDAETVVLTDNFAQTLFGDQDPMGKIIKIDSVNLVRVAGILKDLPANTDMKFDFLLSYAYAKKIGYVDTYWGNNSILTYVLLKEGTSLADFNKKIKNYSKDKINAGNTGLPSTNENFAFPYKDTYLYDNGQGGSYTSGRIQLVRLFAWIGFFILFVACLNFMNLSTARSENRTREIGVRKTLGASRSGLIAQFLVESILISAISICIALCITLISLPKFNALVEKNLQLSLIDTWTWAFLLAFTLVVGILAGIYPAFFLSSFKAIKSLKGKQHINKKGISMRSALVILQFSLAIILIISTIIVSKQIQHTKERDKGYQENGLLYTSLMGDLDKNYTSLRTELLASNAVISVSKNMSPITERYSSGWGMYTAKSTEEDKRITFNRYSSDANAVSNLGLTLLQGRDIDIYNYPTDSTAVLLTETAAKTLHLTEPIGQTIFADGMNWTVVGLIKEFIIDSPYGKVPPMLIFGPKSYFNIIHYRLNPARPTAENIKTITEVFKKFNPDYPFTYEFVDQKFEAKFKEVKSVGTLAMIFAGLTIFISCLGLLALIAYIAETRMKEIAIRKVLGANFKEIAGMLSFDFLKLVLIAFLVATPIAWLAMNNWLADYDYRITIQWYYFVIAGFLALVISLLTISYQTIKAAKAKPVDSLRNE